MLPKEPVHTHKKSVFRKIISVTLKILLGVLLFLVLVVVLIQTSFVQDIIRGKAQKYLAGKLHTKVEIGNVYVGFPHGISLKNIYIEDLSKDTLFSGSALEVDMNMWKLFHGEILVDQIRLKDLTAKIKRARPDTVYNFQFIVDAFASKDPKKAPDPNDTSSVKISVRNVLLDNIRLVYKDDVSGNDMETNIGHSKIKMGNMNLALQQFSIPSIEIKNITARIYQHKPLVGPVAAVSTIQTPKSAPLQLQLSKIDFENIHLDYKDDVSALAANLQLGVFISDVKDMDLGRQVIHLNKIAVDKTTAAISFGKSSTSDTKNTDTTGSSGNGWRVLADHISFADDTFHFDDDNKTRQQSGMDFSHIKADEITFAMDRFLFSKDSIMGSIGKGQLKEQSGFRLDELKGNFLYAANESYIKDFEIRTPGTLIQKSAVLHYPSLAAVSRDLSKLYMDIDLSNSQIQLKDVLTFVPGLRTQPAFKNANNILHIDSRITGNSENLEIKNFKAYGFSNTKIDLRGTIKHATNKKRRYADLVIKTISSGKSDLEMLAPRGTLPANIGIPQSVDISGSVKGGMNDAFADLVLHSTSGSVLVKGTVHQFNDTKAASYDALVQARALNLGLILNDAATYGSVTADLSVKGKGLDKQSIDAVFKGSIHSMELKKYNYQDLELKGSIAHEQLKATAGIDNAAVHLDLNASADLARKYPAVKLELHIDTLDLHALHFVTDTLQVKGDLTADFADVNPDSLQGTANITNLLIVKNTRRFNTDTIRLVAARQGSGEDINLHAEMIDLDWSGKYKITEVGAALQQTVNKYYRVKEGAPVKYTAQDWQMRLTLRPSPLVLSLMPSLKGTDSLGGLISFNSDHNDLRLSLRTPKIKFGTDLIQQLDIEAATTDQQLTYKLQMAKASASGFQLYQSAVYGYLADNHLFTTLLLKDDRNADNYRISGKLDKLEDGLKFALAADSLILNHDQWRVSRDNFFLYDSSGLVINNFKISNNGQSLRINSVSASPTAPVDVVFTDFSIASLTKFAKQDSLLADGVLNGKVEVKNILSTPVFTSDLTIRNLSYKRDTLGDLALKVNNEEANAFAADISIQGHQNDIRLNGKYFTGEGRMDMKLDLNQVNLAAIKPFAVGQLDDIHGYLKGKLAVSGTSAKPLIEGDLHFDSAVVVPSITGEPLKLSKDNIEFDKDGFNFSEFSFLDSANNKATVDGNVYTTDYKDYKFELTFNASNFRVVNAPEATNKLFYGKLNMDAAANVSGDVGSPRLDGDIRVNKATNFTLVLPSNDPEVVSRKGVVRFVDKSHPQDTLIIKSLLDSFSRNAQIKGMDIALNIETDSSALFNVIIDERSGDALSVRGRSDLSFGMDKSGKMSLTGNYEVESGTYNLSLEVLKQKFVIQRGSTITWTGDPTSALINITAAYAVNTAPIDLVEPELAGRPQSEINKFKQKLPFLVTLKMEGEIMKPIITFDITLPDNVLTIWPDVDTKLQQVRSDASELNKQVFALLLLKRFVGENPLESASDPLNAGQMAFQSASQILSNQLNQFAGSLIKGVDINFDLNNEQDYTSGTEQDRTDLNVSVSKKLFSDRVKVNVGSNFELQGQSNPNQNASNIAGDIAIDYQLSKDGRYMMRAYRKNQYELVVEGQVIETGVTFILTLDYNNFKEIFGRSRQQKIEARKLNRAVKKLSTQ